MDGQKKKKNFSIFAFFQLRKTWKKMGKNRVILEAGNHYFWGFLWVLWRNFYGFFYFLRKRLFILRGEKSKNRAELKKKMEFSEKILNKKKKNRKKILSNKFNYFQKFEEKIEMFLIIKTGKIPIFRISWISDFFETIFWISKLEEFRKIQNFEN